MTLNDVLLSLLEAMGTTGETHLVGWDAIQQWPDGALFACRHCYQLAYPSQRETWDDRAARKAGRIRDKLGWEPGILNGNGWKPKGMHWNTFERLTAQHDAFVQVSLAGMAAKLNLLGESLDDWI